MTCLFSWKACRSSVTFGLSGNALSTYINASSVMELQNIQVLVWQLLGINSESAIWETCPVFAIAVEAG